MRIHGTLGSLLLTTLGAYAASLRVLDVTTLGEDPQTTNHLNGESFQQDALVSFNGVFPVRRHGPTLVDTARVRVPICCILRLRCRKRIGEAPDARS